mgnify:CR=1 FL=1
MCAMHRDVGVQGVGGMEGRWARREVGARTDVQPNPTPRPPPHPAHLHTPPHLPSPPPTRAGGFVWLFFGAQGLPADERPPIPLVPELEDSDNWRAVYGERENYGSLGRQECLREKMV